VSARDLTGTKLDNPSPPASSLLPGPIQKAVERVRRAGKH